MQDPKNPPPPLSKTCTEYPKQPFGEEGECTDTGRRYTEKYKPRTNSLPLNVKTQIHTHTRARARTHTRTHFLSELAHYPHTHFHPQQALIKVLSLTHTHSHVALGIRSDLSLLLSEEMRGLRGLRLNRKHSEEPFPDAPS